MGTNSSVFLSDLHHLTCKFDFLDPFVNCNSHPIFLFKLSVIRRFVDDLLVPDMLWEMEIAIT